MNSNLSVGPAATAEGRLRLLTLYADFPAAVRLKWLTGQVARMAGRGWEPRVGMWRLDSVTPNSPINDMIAQEAGEADLFVIAMSSLDQREPALTQRLESVAAWKTNRPVPGLLVGLLGDEEHQAGELDWTLSQLRDFARRARMVFIWRWMDHEAMKDASWLVDIVEALLAAKKSVCSLELGATTPPVYFAGDPSVRM